MIKLWFISFLLRLYLNLILITCKFKVHGEKNLNNALESSHPLMLCCWHERLVFLMCYFKSWKNRLWVLSSQHRDSEILAYILKSWNFNLIKGSSTRGWFGAIKEISKLFESKNAVVAITNDGPKGPPLAAKPGTLKIGLKKEATIMAMSAISTRFWTINTWDQLKLPKPFSVIHVVFCTPYENFYDLEHFNNYLTKHQNNTDTIINECN